MKQISCLAAERRLLIWQICLAPSKPNYQLGWTADPQLKQICVIPLHCSADPSSRQLLRSFYILRDVIQHSTIYTWNNIFHGNLWFLGCTAERGVAYESRCHRWQTPLSPTREEPGRPLGPDADKRSCLQKKPLWPYSTSTIVLTSIPFVLFLFTIFCFVMSDSFLDHQPLQIVSLSLPRGCEVCRNTSSVLVGAD